ncbi:bifunctional polysaccharide deacetylase/glycosyltransferase family 2 protein [Dactylosporangium darangshiense]|uniref:bifunctional polysaccharide deacetylase/glycosyltransferase family 2 protein n=1 Tax=Dactylosporangium darangshiense TaxID=579108 RepID=UPI0036281EA8
MTHVASKPDPNFVGRSIKPFGRWIVTAILLGVFSSVLLVEAYVNAGFVSDHAIPPGAYDTVPDTILQGGPIIDTTRGAVRSFHLPNRTIALTFDDGPDPTWTPRILQVLRRHRVNATFFVVGAQVSRHPQLVEQMFRAGDEVGIHTFTHPRLSELPRWRQHQEYSQTQMAIVRATGHKAALVRLPYSSTADAIDDANWDLIRDTGRLGYINVMTEADSRDWERPGTDAIVRNAIPPDGKSATVLLHDAGGDRMQTVAALDRLIPLLQQRGYTFTTVSDGLRKTLTNPQAGAGPAVIGNPPASAADERQGFALVTVIQIADETMSLLFVLFIAVGALTVARTFALFALAGRHARRRRSATWSWGPPVNEPVTVIVPAFNEQEGIEAAVRSLAGGDYPGGIEVVVVDDGSTDDTAGIVERLQLPNVRVVRIPNGGKPNALNVGMTLTDHDIVVMVDGDTVFEPDSVRHLVQPFADPNVGAVAGNVKVGNRTSVVARWQHIEYVIGFNLDRRLYDVMRCMPTVPGAIGAFRRQALLEIGGMSDDTLAEDTDVTMALCRNGWQVVYEERARAWTEAPATLRQLWLQRYRWSYGTMQAMWKHRCSVVERGPSGRFGRVGLPLLALFGILLPLLAPIIDILLVYGLLFTNRIETAAAWLAMLGLQALAAVVAFRLDREKLTPLWVLPLQQFVYRQLMYLVLIQSLVTALTGARLRWHKLRRTGSAGVAAPVSRA